ncbi:MAG: DUF6788 family protein [Ktedonobacteraceae bacterium]
MNGNITYHQQISYCGKPRCRKCRDGQGHGPYWYAYRTENGRTTRTYIGKNLPAELQIIQETPQEQTSTEDDRAVLRIRVLGQFSMERKQGQSWQTVEDSPWQHQRVRTLLACLLSSPGRRLGREQIMDALWPEADMETASNRLDRGVYSLRQILEPLLSRPALSQLLRIEREGLLLADQSHIWVDADAFESLLSQAHATNDPREAEKLLEEAVALYGGDFLPEERLAEWTMPRREALQRSWLGLLLELADLRIASTAFAHAIEPLDRLLAADPSNEAAVQRLIISLAQLDRRGEALRAYHRFATALKRDYNVAPLLETRNLYEAVQQGETQFSIALPVQNPQRTQAEAANDLDAPASTRQSYKVQIGRSHQNPLIGRDSELEIMRQVLDATEQETRASAPGRKKISALQQERQHRPQCILLVGEAGIGKTRLAEELSHEAQKRGWAVAWSRVYAQESGVPYRQWTEILRNAMTQGQWQNQEISKHPLVFQPLSTLLPELHDLLPPIVFPTPLSPEQEQLRLWEAALKLLTMMSERTPLLLVLDDFHWADASSSELFAYLVRRLHGRPIILVGTYRDNELTAANPLRSLLTDLQREQAMVHLPIQPLTNEQISSLVSHISHVPHLSHLPETMVQFIQVRAAGNPFFAEELARSLETLSIASTDAAATNQVEPSSTTETIYPLPDTIAAVLELRMSRLSSACQRFLGNAAVLGGSFTFNIIAQLEVSGADGANSMSEDTLLDLIEEAIQAGVLTEEGTGTRITYHFWHPLLVSHLYDQLSAARRARLHRRAAAVLQRVYSGREAENAATITNHLLKGGAEAEFIVHFAEMAADRAYSLSAYPEAEQYYRIAVAQLDEQNGSSLPTASAELEHLSYLLERLGECMRVQGNSAEARSAYERVLTMRHHQRLLTSIANEQHEAQIDAILWREIGVTWYDMGNTTLARQSCEHGEQVLRESGVKGGQAWAILRFEQSYIYWREGNYDTARQMAQEAQQIFEETIQHQNSLVNSDVHLTTTKRTLAGDPTNLGRTHRLLAAIAATVGQLSDALIHLDTALALFEQADLQREIANTCCNIGDVHLRKAEHEAAQAFFRRSLNLAQRVGDIPLISIVYCSLGEVSTRSGDLKEAEALLKNGLTLAEKINEQVYINVLCVDLAIVTQDQDKLAEASTYIYQALIAGRSIRNTPCISLALVALGNWRIAQAITLRQAQTHSDPSIRLLLRARKTLERALANEGLDAEARIKGQLAIALILLLFGETEKAQQLAVSTMEEAQQSELLWGYLCTQRLLGDILAAQSQQKQAEYHFVQAMQAFQTAGMRLEYARTLYSYGTALLQAKGTEKARNHQQGLSYLHEAQQIFGECHALLDLHNVERVLTAHPAMNIHL